MRRHILATVAFVGAFAAILLVGAGVAFVGHALTGAAWEALGMGEWLATFI